MKTLPKATLLFQGDSITDCGRKDRKGNNLGNGYVSLVAIWLQAMYPELDIRVLNRGVNGNKIKDLQNRWQKDTLDIEPDILSILVGINDVVNGSFWDGPTSIQDFENSYRSILVQTRNSVDCKIVLMEPFLVTLSRAQEKLRENLDQKTYVVRKLSKEFNAVMVSLDKVFYEASKKREPNFWSQDGYHPTPVGHALIAQSWLDACRPLFGKLLSK